MSTQKNKQSTNEMKYQSNDPVRRMLIQNFLKVLSAAVSSAKPGTILDAGCGEGFVLSHLKKQGIIAKATGIDVSEDAVAAARKNVSGITFTSCSIYKLPFKDNEFDTVLCNEVLEHLESPEKALAELKRVARNRIILSVPHEPWFMLGSLAGGKYISHFGNHPEHINHWTAWSFRSFLERNGLRVRSLHVMRTFPWTLAECEVQKKVQKKGA